MPSLRLKEGRDRSVRRRHPWVFQSAIDRVEGDPSPGATVEILSAHNEWLARASFSPPSLIRARIWTWDETEQVGPDLIARRWHSALAARERWIQPGQVDAFREVNAESDGLPGIIVDRYGPYRVVQITTAGAEVWRTSLVELLASQGGIQGVYERSDVDVREREGLEPRTGILAGDVPSGQVEIQEYGLRFGADLREGQKTGFYLDQRENRRLLRSLVEGADVLDCFAYTGGFSVAALSGSAGHVLAVESSAQALGIAEENLARNGLAREHWEGRQADVFEELRHLRDRGQSFDAVILDPPRFAPTSAQVDRAARGYKDINLLAFKLIRPGGLLITFSCSGGVEAALFQKIVAAAALDAGVEAKIQNWLGQPADHPVAIAFPEGRYLKGLVCRVG